MNFITFEANNFETHKWIVRFKSSGIALQLFRPRAVTSDKDLCAHNCFDGEARCCACLDKTYSKYRTNHTVNEWVQCMGCNKERQSKFYYKQATRIENGEIRNTTACMLFILFIITTMLSILLFNAIQNVHQGRIIVLIIYQFLQASRHHMTPYRTTHLKPKWCCRTQKLNEHRPSKKHSHARISLSGCCSHNDLLDQYHLQLRFLLGLKLTQRKQPRELGLKED